LRQRRFARNDAGEEVEMKTQQLLNYARDRWVPGEASSLAEIASAIDVVGKGVSRQITCTRRFPNTI